jgi:hypothetical protein
MDGDDCPAGHLPDELWVKILAILFQIDIEALLECVPAVCRRFHRLYRDAARGQVLYLNANTPRRALQFNRPRELHVYDNSAWSSCLLLSELQTRSSPILSARDLTLCTCVGGAFPICHVHTQRMDQSCTTFSRYWACNGVLFYPTPMANVINTPLRTWHVPIVLLPRSPREDFDRYVPIELPSRTPRWEDFLEPLPPPAPRATPLTKHPKLKSKRPPKPRTPRPRNQRRGKGN